MGNLPPCPPHLSEADHYTWDLGDDEGEDRRWRAGRFPRLPLLFQMPVAKEYRRIHRSQGRKTANLYLLAMSSRFDHRVASLATDPSEAKRYAKARAKDCLALRGKEQCDVNAYKMLCEYVVEREFTPPELTDQITLAGALNRMCNELWWRGIVRRKYSELFEVAAIQCGMVHAQAGMYVSDETLRAFDARRKRNLDLLQSLNIMNEDGQEYVLADLVALSVSNPKNRRNELMARLYGFDLIAKKLNHSGLFVTVTCPSRMHPRYKSSGDKNSRYDLTTPRQANSYLGRLWACIRATLKNDGIHVYGFRVAEPQHDGTPHWHLLLYTAPNRLEYIQEIFRRYALMDSPDEKGASSSRCKFKLIDWNKGTGIGYMAKYISKNIDGEHLGSDINGGDSKDNSLRVAAWASVHRIRQFQQFGGPPITCWRELRKIAAASDGLLEQARLAADDGNWELFTELFGGTRINRKDHPIKLLKAYSDEAGKYGEPRGEQIFGVTDGSNELVTRIHKWTVSRGGAKAPLSARG